MLLSPSEASGSGLTQLQLPREVVEFMDDKKVCKLPQSSNCSSQVEFSLKGNFELTALSPIYFRRMTHLQVLDLSHTSIKSLPKSLFKLISLKSLMLRGCQLFMELSPQVGKLTNLEELDLDQTEIMDLPIEIGELPKLRQLRVSFYQTCGKQKLKWNLLIHPETVSILTQLTELSIDVNPADKRWDDLVEAVVQAACKSMTLRTLNLFLPKFQLLDYLSSTYHSLSRFRFTVGHHRRRIISRVPHEVEAEFRNWEKCLKFVNGDTIPIEIQGALNYSTSFFLDNHVTATSLSEFGIENMKRLKFCLLAECDNMETIIDGERHHKGYEDDGSESDLRSAKTALESLQYMNIYYMDSLTSIWRGPNGFGYMPKLKILALHTCPRLINIFSHSMLENFVNLEELILEDCPQVTSLVSHASVIPMMSDKFLPSLKRLLLLYLPQLVTISNGLPIAQKLESIGFYNCPKLKSISKMELSSKSLNIIKGESQWWKDLNWDESEWGNWPDYLTQIFLPINHEQDVMTQMAEDKDIFEATIQNESKNLDCLEERKTGTDVTKPSPLECVFPSIPELEGNGREKKQRKSGEKMTEQGRGSKLSAPTRPTITLPPRPTMDGLFSGSGFSPGPMTLVSAVFSEPGARIPYSSTDGSFMDTGFNGGGEKSPGFKQNLTPLFTVPPGLSPSGLLNSPAFFSVSPQSPFGMSHQQALAHVTAQAAFAQSNVHAQPEYQNFSSAAHKETSQQLPPSAFEPQSCAMKYSEALQSDRKNQPYVAVDKPAEDGYNWQKYGQKLIKGCEYPCTYYKCTHLKCLVKKKVERSADGQRTKIIYEGAHNHDKPQSNKQAKGGSEGNANSQANPEQGSQGAAGNSIKLIEAVPAYAMPGKNHEYTESAVELPSDREEGCDEESRQEKDKEPNVKRRNTSAEFGAVLSHKKVTERKIIVQTRSEVDILDDGYKWRKYGKKSVKGSPNPRNYYRCASSGCNVRKRVERASTDPKAVITTYEGEHNHDVPSILQETTRFSWGKPSVGSPLQFS